MRGRGLAHRGGVFPLGTSSSEGTTAALQQLHRGRYSGGLKPSIGGRKKLSWGKKNLATYIGEIKNFRGPVRLDCQGRSRLKSEKTREFHDSILKTAYLPNGEGKLTSRLGGGISL